MAKDILGEAGLHFDELNKLRVLDPEVTQQTIELKEECKDFVDKIGQFQKIVGGLIELVDQLAKEAENEKMKAIGARNLLKSIAKQREAQQQQLQALIAEKKMQLERYRVEYEALCKVEAEQNEFIDQFIFQKWTENFIGGQKNKQNPKKPLYCSSDLTNGPRMSWEMVCKECSISEGSKQIRELVTDVRVQLLVNTHGHGGPGSYLLAFLTWPEQSVNSIFFFFL